MAVVGVYFNDSALTLTNEQHNALYNAIDALIGSGIGAALAAAGGEIKFEVFNKPGSDVQQYVLQVRAEKN